MSQQGISKISLHFDELDKGLSNLDSDREKMFIGLVLAARYFHANNKTSGRICPIVYLRTDIWDQMSFSDKNKISQSSSVLLEWDSDALKKLVDLRISGKAGSGLSWNDIEDGALMRGSQTKWNHIVSRTFLRPRDVISF